MNFDRIKLVFAAKAVCPPSWQWRNRGNSGLLNLWYVAAGNGELEQVGQRFELNEGTCFIVREWVPHVAIHDPRRCLTVPWIQFHMLDEKGRVCRPDDDELLGEYRVLPERGMLAGLMDRCIDAWNYNDKGAAEHWLISCLREVQRQDILAHGAAESHQRSVIDNAATLIEQFPERQWNIAQMSKMAGYSTDHFIRLFRQFRGTTPRHYQIRCRIAAAMNLLRFSDAPIGQIADDMGYPDIYSFSRQFRQVMGRSPRTFRE